jgi:cytochrome c oxidase subunit 1
MSYLAWSLRYGKPATANPWNADGLEWQTASPPPTENFHEQPTVTSGPEGELESDPEPELRGGALVG